MSLTCLWVQSGGFHYNYSIRIDSCSLGCCVAMVQNFLNILAII